MHFGIIHKGKHSVHHSLACRKLFWDFLCCPVFLCPTREERCGGPGGWEKRRRQGKGPPDPTLNSSIKGILLLASKYLCAEKKHRLLRKCCASSTVSFTPVDGSEVWLLLPPSALEPPVALSGPCAAILFSLCPPGHFRGLPSLPPSSSSLPSWLLRLQTPLLSPCTSPACPLGLLSMYLSFC